MIHLHRRPIKTPQKPPLFHYGTGQVTLKNNRSKLSRTLENNVHDYKLFPTKKQQRKNTLPIDFVFSKDRQTRLTKRFTNLKKVKRCTETVFGSQVCEKCRRWRRKETCGHCWEGFFPRTESRRTWSKPRDKAEDVQDPWLMKWLQWV